MLWSTSGSEAASSLRCLSEDSPKACGQPCLRVTSTKGGWQSTHPPKSDPVCVAVGGGILTDFFLGFLHHQFFLHSSVSLALRTRKPHEGTQQAFLAVLLWPTVVSQVRRAVKSPESSFEVCLSCPGFWKAPEKHVLLLPYHHGAKFGCTCNFLIWSLFVKLQCWMEQFWTLNIIREFNFLDISSAELLLFLIVCAYVLPLLFYWQKDI